MAERLCANFRHFVYNPDKHGTGNSTYEHDKLLISSAHGRERRRFYERRIPR